ncbi:ArsR/SmtB family transcription factor [Polymorphum gilvum]|uniref:Putative transcriptional regulator, ArsR family n=1 Tax=Polymorphum gilvum (strain LMG 25793 / CGMCC 1.9160 / SL003B-26A1) TaxID=991905 RepID=F2IX79_POLGS|nr:metalloregulator ArsR/SmtB family transcription factor [Polymorphum gilvum]ADZ69370.1 Putative transcriptional regulator, ArsR family [Polymorphum gilvum SL003B-26A1]
MDEIKALQAFSALSQETRLAVFRLLIQCGQDGCLAGDIARKLDVRQNTLSTNLGILQGAGLIASRREGRAVRYFADFEGIRGLLGFLLENCCGGEPDLCQPLIEKIACAC